MPYYAFVHGYRGKVLTPIIRNRSHTKKEGHLVEYMEVNHYGNVY